MRHRWWSHDKIWMVLTWYEIGDGLTVKRIMEVMHLRAIDRFRPFNMFLFVIGMFHFYWYVPFVSSLNMILFNRYCLIINHVMMWKFGFQSLAKLLQKSKRVTKDCKKFNDCNQFFNIVFDGTLFRCTLT